MCVQAEGDRASFPLTSYKCTELVLGGVEIVPGFAVLVYSTFVGPKNNKMVYAYFNGSVHSGSLNL